MFHGRLEDYDGFAVVEGIEPWTPLILVVFDHFTSLSIALRRIFSCERVA